jgi:uncharacterized protein (DUF1778 family)
MEQKAKETRLNVRVAPRWHDRLSVAAKLSNTDVSEFVRQAADEKIDRLKIEKPGFAVALAAALQLPPEQRIYSVDLQSVT